MGAEWKHQLRERAEAAGASLSEEQCAAMARFVELLYAWNKRMNLTRVPMEHALERHLVDSLTIAAAVDMNAGGRALDIGTGGGLPGVPLSIAYPRWHFDLLDGTLKKLRFVDTVADELDLRNLRTIHARAEDLSRTPAAAGRYDLVVARAVAPLDRLAGWMLPFVRPGGRAVAYKSTEAREEIEAAKEAMRAHGGELQNIVTVNLPESGAGRLLVVLRKVEGAGKRGRRLG